MNTSYRKTALSRLVSQFCQQPKITGLVDTMVAPIESLSSDLQGLKQQRWIDNAEGKQLDGCGSIAGVSRAGRLDTEYRIAIKAAILSNISTATPHALIEGVRFLTSPQQVQYLESYPACALLFTDGQLVTAQSQMILHSMAPAAISTLPLMVNYGRTAPMRMGKITYTNKFSVNQNNHNAQLHPLQTDKGTLNIQAGSATGQARLSGLRPKHHPITGNGAAITAGIGILSIGNWEIIDNGYHLTGVFP